MRVSRSTGYEVGTLSMLKGGTISRNLDVRVMETCETECVSRLDVGRDLVRVYMDVSWPDGGTASECLGTFLPSVPSRRVMGGYSTSTVKMSGRLQELLDDSPKGPLVVEKGANAVNVAKSVCTGMGLEVVADASSYVTSRVRTYGIGVEQNNSEVGETKLDMVNDLLGLAGFWAAKTDSRGRILMRRYDELADRAPAWEYVEGPMAKFEAQMEEERDVSGVANHVVCVYSTDDATVVGEAWDTDPESEFSTVSVGRTITKGYTYSELPSGNPTDQRETAVSQANRLLRQNQSVINRVSMRGVYAPVSVTEAVNLDYPSGNLSGKFEIRTQELSLTAGCPTQTELRRFTR
jgi:hypothetical protein